MPRQKVLVVGFRRVEFTAKFDRCDQKCMKQVRLIKLRNVGAGDVRLFLGGGKDR